MEKNNESSSLAYTYPQMHKKYPLLFGEDRDTTVKRLALVWNLVREVHGELRRAYKHKLASRSDHKDCNALGKKVSANKVMIY